MYRNTFPKLTIRSKEKSVTWTLQVRSGAFSPNTIRKCFECTRMRSKTGVTDLAYSRSGKQFVIFCKQHRNLGDLVVFTRIGVVLLVQIMIRLFSSTKLLVLYVATWIWSIPYCLFEYPEEGPSVDYIFHP